MEEKILFMLMNIIKNNTSTRMLAREGFSYLQISKAMEVALEKKYIRYENNFLELTDKGKKYHEKYETHYKKRKKEDWIEKDLKNKIPQIDNNTIFVPSISEINLITKYSESTRDKQFNNIGEEIHPE